MLEKINKVGSLLSYREDIKVMDCTIRDGGLMNDFKFDDKFVKEVYNACLEAGVDYMEFGYKGSEKLFDVSEYGPWKFAKEEDLRRIVGDNNTDLKIAVMADVNRTDMDLISDKKDSVVDMIRTACYINQIPSAIEMVNNFHEKGYETTVNIMAVSHCSETEIEEALEILGKSKVNIIYLVDSFGHYFPEEIRGLARKYLAIGEKYNKTIGIHAHNNQQLAFANTIEALTIGVSYLDATIANLGRAAGNCPLELLLGFLKNPRYKIRPILQVIEGSIMKLKEEGLKWGFDIPYMITGQLNRHPRAAMKNIGTDDWEQYTKFFDSILDED